MTQSTCLRRSENDLGFSSALILRSRFSHQSTLRRAPDRPYRVFFIGKDCSSILLISVTGLLLTEYAVRVNATFASRHFLCGHESSYPLGPTTRRKPTTRKQ